MGNAILGRKTRTHIQAFVPGSHSSPCHFKLINLPLKGPQVRLAISALRSGNSWSQSCIVTWVNDFNYHGWSMAGVVLAGRMDRSLTVPEHTEWIKDQKGKTNISIITPFWKVVLPGVRVASVRLHCYFFLEILLWFLVLVFMFACSPFPLPHVFEYLFHPIFSFLFPQPTAFASSSSSFHVPSLVPSQYFIIQMFIFTAFLLPHIIFFFLRCFLLPFKFPHSYVSVSLTPLFIPLSCSLLLLPLTSHPQSLHSHLALTISLASQPSFLPHLFLLPLLTSPSPSPPPPLAACRRLLTPNKGGAWPREHLQRCLN